MAKLPQFTEAECKGFADAANPHQWFLVADNLHEQAVGLYKLRKQGGKVVRRGRNETTIAWDNTNKATFLLCALALENAIKALLVYENPDWIGDGYLHAEMCSHKLASLGDRSTLIPYRKRDRWVLVAFEQGNESWMRYPCGRRANDVQAEESLHHELWSGYSRVMRGYGNKLIKLLGKGWSGPHGVGGRWEVAGEWLGGGSPLPHGFAAPKI
ncbi:hypothetical protein [Caulobacter sp. DWP3-1-3b2]|uniref:hypothetical protein n=1 Tax=Caulobacter sp. DWP3-1-3b2 TaxID=2804643 RepID=UPI003CF9100F